MDENRTRILNESTQIINKLQVISSFFDAEITYKIFLRSQVINKIFENNTELDINKLELFHLQFTDSVVELLKKVKKNNEKNITLLFEEIQLNKDVIEKLVQSVYTEASYNLDKQRQSLKINQSLKKLYQVFSNYTTEYPFPKNINTFSSNYSQDFYYEIPLSLLEDLTHFETADVYSNEYATIQKKLMGLLCKNDFKSEFLFGIKYANQVAEVYQLTGSVRNFLFFPSGNLFLFSDLSKLESIDKTNGVSKRNKIIQELRDKNNQLQNSETLMKSYIPDDIKVLLGDYYKKISEFNFLQNSDFEIQANILKTMLNTVSM